MPTLNLSPAASPLLPPSIAASPIAPVGAGDGPSDAFAAMLAALTSDPMQATNPGTQEGATSALPAGPQLPQVRQDPAVWMPEEADLPPVAPPPAISADPAQPGPIVFGPDCEFPAFDTPLQVPKLNDAPVPIVPPGPVEVAPKFWPLKLNSALTPARLPAPRATVAEKAAADAPAPKAALDAPLPPVSVVQEPPVATPMPLPSPLPVAPALPLPPQPVQEEAAVGVQTQAAPARLRSIAPEPATLPNLPAAESVAPVPTSPSVAETRQGQSVKAETNTPVTLASAGVAPEVPKQVAQAIDATRVVRDLPAAVATDPAQPAPSQAPATPLAAATVQPQPVASIAAPAAAQPTQAAPLDLGRAEWVQAMVDRIAELPQAEGRREAQIRLIPDALGRVDVSIVERDERLQVTFNAETAQARQLLSEAAPRLQELAEARGLRFAQMEVGGGQPQDRRGAHDQQQPSTPQRPRSASADTDTDHQPDGELIA